MQTEFNKMLSGAIYNPNDAELVKLRLQARQRSRAFNESEDAESEVRNVLLNQLLGSVGEGSWIEPDFRCDYGCNIHVGKQFFANFNCVILDVCEVRIGDQCLLGPQVGIYTASHPLNPIERGRGVEFGQPITIGDQVWIGGGAIILPGVTIGDGAVIAAGAVVTRNVAPATVVAGNPSRVIRTC